MPLLNVCIAQITCLPHEVSISVTGYTTHIQCPCHTTAMFHIHIMPVVTCRTIKACKMVFIFADTSLIWLSGKYSTVTPPPRGQHGTRYVFQIYNWMMASITLKVVKKRGFQYLYIGVFKLRVTVV